VKYAIAAVLVSLLIAGCVQPNLPTKEEANLIEKAAMANDTAPCAELTSEELRNGCYYRVATNAANINLGACEKITDYRRDRCVQGLGEALADVSLCEKIPESSSARWECIADIGINLESLETCDKAGERRASCYSGVASKTDDAVLCGQIVDELERNVCYWHIGAKRGDTAFCEKLPKDTSMAYLRDYCYMDIAIERGDREMCEKVAIKMYRNDCLVGVNETLRWKRA